MDYEQADALNHAIRVIGIKHRARAGALLVTLGLHPGQEIILQQLDAHGPRTQAQLAAGAACEPPSVTLMVQKLEAAGLISRSPSRNDGRAMVVELTRQGRELIPKLRELWQKLAEQTVAGLTSTPIDQLLAALTDLSNSLQVSTRAANPSAERGDTRR